MSALPTCLACGRECDTDDRRAPLFEEDGYCVCIPCADDLDEYIDMYDDPSSWQPLDAASHPLEANYRLAVWDPRDGLCLLPIKFGTLSDAEDYKSAAYAVWETC